jgi:WD40 repeat protein
MFLDWIFLILLTVYRLVECSSNFTLSNSTLQVSELAFSSDHSYLASQDANKITIWNTASRNFIKSLANIFSYCALVALPNNQLASSSGNNINIWSPLTSNSAQKTLTEHILPVSALDISPNGLWLASGSKDKTIKIWNYTSSSNAIKNLTGHSDTVSSLLFYSNEILVSGASVSDFVIKVWNVNTCSCLVNLTGHTSGINALAMLPNGLVASGSSDMSIRIWNITQSFALYTLTGHSQGVNALALINNQYLASGSKDTNIIIWEFGSFSKVKSWQASLNLITSLAFDSSLNVLASGDSAGLISLFSLSDLGKFYSYIFVDFFKLLSAF